jgi:hypothetical protein
MDDLKLGYITNWKKIRTEPDSLKTTYRNPSIHPSSIRFNECIIQGG